MCRPCLAFAVRQRAAAYGMRPTPTSTQDTLARPGASLSAGVGDAVRMHQPPMRAGLACGCGTPHPRCRRTLAVKVETKTTSSVVPRAAVEAQQQWPLGLADGQQQQQAEGSELLGPRRSSMGQRVGSSGAEQLEAPLLPTHHEEPASAAAAAAGPTPEAAGGRLDQKDGMAQLAWYSKALLRKNTTTPKVERFEAD